MNKYKTAIRALETNAYYPIRLSNSKVLVPIDGIEHWTTNWHCVIGKASGDGNTIAEAVKWALNHLKEFNETSCESCRIENCGKKPEREFSTCEDWQER